MTTIRGIDLSKRFRRAGKPRRETMSMTVEGKRNTGKSRFCFTMPKPLAIINIDDSLEGVEQKVESPDDIFISEYSSFMPHTLNRNNDAKVKEYFADLWTEILEDLYSVVDSGQIKSLAIDGGSDLWEICRYMHFGRLEKVPSQYYTEANADFESIINHTKRKCNLVITHRVKDVWEDKTYIKSNGEPATSRAPKIGEDGEIVTARAGYKDIGFKVDASLLFRYIPPERDLRKPDRPVKKNCDGQFFADVLMCKDDMSLNGESVPGGLTFAEAASMIYPDYAEVWGS